MTIGRALSTLVIGPGPDISLAAARALVNDLRMQAARAPELVGKYAGLEEAAQKATQLPVRVVDRASWTAGATKSVMGMIEHTQLSSRAIEYQISIAMAVLSANVLGQFDPYNGRRTGGTLYLVAPNIAKFQERYNLDRRDLALWVAVHEMTHAVQYAQAPWLADYVANAAINVFSAESEETIEQAMEDITGVMSLLEGHASYVMDSLPLAVLPSRHRLSQALAQRRASGNHLVKKLGKLLGADKKNAQYTSGLSFTREVVRRVGLEGFNQVWKGPEYVPSANEIQNPAEWIKRVIP